MLTEHSASVSRRSASRLRPTTPGHVALQTSSVGQESNRLTLRTWPQISGRTTGGDVVRALEEYPSGALITGASGTGKTYLVSRVTEQIRNDCHVVVLRASAGLNGTPYGTLNVLLRDLDPQCRSHPALVLAALSGLLNETGAGKRVFLVIENAADVDEFAGMVISQLARNGTAGLILTCTDPQRLCSDLSRLYTDSSLARFELPPLTLPEATTWLEAGLGARVSASAAHEIWAASGGNPHYLKMLAEELVESGSLVVVQGVWVLTATERPHGRAMTDMIMTRLGSLGNGERKALEIVSLARTVPLDALLDLASPEDIDSLERRGILLVGDSLPRMVGLQNQLLREVVRANIPTGRSSDLRSQFCRVVEPSLQTPALTLTLAQWALECGTSLSREDALQAAIIANQSADHVLALRLVRSISHYRSSAAAVAEEVVALAALGAASEALVILRQYKEKSGAAAGTEEDPSTFIEEVRLELAEVAVLQSNPGTKQEAVERLKRIRAVLDGRSPGKDMRVLSLAEDVSAASYLRELLVLAEAKSASQSGRYLEASMQLEEALHNFETHKPEFRVTAGSWLCEAWALTGRQSEAAELAGQLLADSRNTLVPPAVAWMAAGRLRLALVLAGRWETAASIPPPQKDSVFPSAQLLPAYGDLSLAILRCLQGQADEGLELLVPVIGQLRARDEEGLLAVAYAAAAYASLLLGDPGNAKQYLIKSESSPLPPSYTMLWIKRYFTVLAGSSSDAQTVISQLLQLADAAQEVGVFGLEIFALSIAVRRGSTMTAARLLDSAGKSEGDFAGLCSTYAQAVLSGDATQQLAAAQLAQDLHNDRFAFDIAETVLRSEQARQDRRLLRQARQLLEVCRQRMGGPQYSGQQGNRITSRELEIARLAANGSSNKAIAAKLHVSVRTVEGHLYQIYGKLHIVERSELALALGDFEGGRQ